jgi:Ca2+/Na+ antiporter
MTQTAPLSAAVVTVGHNYHRLIMLKCFFFLRSCLLLSTRSDGLIVCLSVIIILWPIFSLTITPLHVFINLTICLCVVIPYYLFLMNFSLHSYVYNYHPADHLTESSSRSLNCQRFFPKKCSISGKFLLSVFWSYHLSTLSLSMFSKVLHQSILSLNFIPLEYIL